MLIQTVPLLNKDRILAALKIIPLLRTLTPTKIDKNKRELHPLIVEMEAVVMIQVLAYTINFLFYIGMYVDCKVN